MQNDNENEDLIFMEIARKLSEIIKTITNIFMEIRGIFVVIYVQKNTTVMMDFIKTQIAVNCPRMTINN